MDEISDNTIIPSGYNPQLDKKGTKTATQYIKNTFSEIYSEVMNVDEIPAPSFIEASTGINDGLSGVEIPVRFNIETGQQVEVPFSLAKWKIDQVTEDGYSVDKGIFVRGTYFRPHEVLSNRHSWQLEQLDHETVISKSDRTDESLRKRVNKIYEVLNISYDKYQSKYGKGDLDLGKSVAFTTGDELQQMYPDLEPDEREREFVRNNPVAFVQGIGYPLGDFAPHGMRSPDYDDHLLNGDLVVWNDVIGDALELSSMGIRVDKSAMVVQMFLKSFNTELSKAFGTSKKVAELYARVAWDLRGLLENGAYSELGSDDIMRVVGEDLVFSVASLVASHSDDYVNYVKAAEIAIAEATKKMHTTRYHNEFMTKGKLQTFGGGIGLDRVAMLYMKKAHIAEVQPMPLLKETRTKLEDANIMAL